MGVERRDAGRWMREGQTDGSETRRQCPATAKTSRRNPRPLGLGRNRRVWTERMLTALEQGVKGGSMVQPDGQGLRACANLRAAFAKVAANEGSGGSGPPDGRDVRRSTWRTNLARLGAIAADRDVPSAGGAAGLDSQSRAAKKRAPWASRRCGTGWCRRRCATCWNRSSSGTSRSTATGFARDAAAKTRCAGWTSCCKQGIPYVVDADLKSYFDTIPHDRLMERVRGEGRRRPRAGR